MLTFLAQTHYPHSLNLAQCHFVTTEMKLCLARQPWLQKFDRDIYSFKTLKKWLKLMKYISFNHLLTSKIVVFTETFFFHCVHVMKACLHFRLKNVIDSSATIQWKRNLIIQQYEVRAHGSNEMGFWKSSCTLITLQICSLTTFWIENIMLYSCFKTQLASVITISTCIIKQHSL